MTSNVTFYFHQLDSILDICPKKIRYFLMYSILGLRFFVVNVVNVPINGSGRKNIKYVSSRNVLCAGL